RTGAAAGPPGRRAGQGDRVPVAVRQRVRRRAAPPGAPRGPGRGPLPAGAGGPRLRRGGGAAGGAGRPPARPWGGGARGGGRRGGGPGGDGRLIQPAASPGTADVLTKGTTAAAALKTPPRVRDLAPLRASDSAGTSLIFLVTAWMLGGHMAATPVGVMLGGMR